MMMAIVGKWEINAGAMGKLANFRNTIAKLRDVCETGYKFVFDCL